ncbi:unnamed protein product, partial [Darwinula stevensoni]
MVNIAEVPKMSYCRIWTPFKELFEAVDNVVYKHDAFSIPDLESCVRKHRSALFSPLQNPGKDASERERVRKAAHESIILAKSSVPVQLPEILIEEALILSDMYNLSEIAAVELLLLDAIIPFSLGESEMVNFPNLPRGLVAVLLYYDGRRDLARALKALVQGCQGRTWTLGLSADLAALLGSYVDELVQEGLVSKILKLLKEMDMEKEMGKLGENRALGDRRHRHQVMKMYQETQLALAQTIFCLAAQKGLSRSDLSRLLSHLSKQSGMRSPDASMDEVLCALFMAALYSLDLSLLTTELDDSTLVNIPLLADKDMIGEIHDQLSSTTEAWESEGLQGVIQLAWSIALRHLSQSPFGQGYDGYLEEDEAIFSMALDGRPFFFLSHCVLNNSEFYQEEFYVRRLHGLLAEFLCSMPLKVKELRNRADEIARIEAARAHDCTPSPLNHPRHFQELMVLVVKLYSKDPLKLELQEEYWGPMQPEGTCDRHQHVSSRQIALVKFVRLAGDLVPPALFVSYVDMLASLAASPKAAPKAFQLLKLNSFGQGGSKISWDHFFWSLTQYYHSLRHEESIGTMTALVPGMGPRAAAPTPAPTPSKGISPQEVAGLQAVLRLVTAIAGSSESLRLALYEHPSWAPVVVMMGLITCPIPIALKAELLTCLQAFAASPEIAPIIWQGISGAGLLQENISAFSASKGIAMELEEIETRGEEYPMTRAFLGLLSMLMESGPLPTSFPAVIPPFLHFLINSVFLKHQARSYRNAMEKWEVGSLCLEILEKSLSVYEATKADFAPLAAPPPGFHILQLLLKDSQLLQMVVNVICQGREEYEQRHMKGNAIEKAMLLGLCLLSTALEKQEAFLLLERDNRCAFVAIPLQKLLISIQPKAELIYVLPK